MTNLEIQELQYKDNSIVFEVFENDKAESTTSVEFLNLEVLYQLRLHGYIHDFAIDGSSYEFEWCDDSEINGEHIQDTGIAYAPISELCEFEVQIKEVMYNEILCRLALRPHTRRRTKKINRMIREGADSTTVMNELFKSFAPNQMS